MPVYNPWLMAGLMTVNMVALGFVFIIRDTLTSSTLFGVAAMFAFFAGIAFALLTKNIH